MPHDNIPGWAAFGPLYRSFAANLAKTGDKVVETGLLFGKSIVLLDEEARARGVQLDIWGVDPFEDNGHWLPATHPFRDLAMSLGGPYAAFNALMYKDAPQTLERLHVLRMPSVQGSRFFEDGSLAMVMIDDAHSYEGCLESIRAWLPKVRAGGVLAGDDYDEANFPGVVRAVREVFSDDFHVQGTTWIAGSRRDWEAPADAAAPPPSQYDGSVEGIEREYDLGSLPDLNEPTVLDVGANRGSFALAVLRRYPGAKVECYEPHPDAFSQLEQGPLASVPLVHPYNAAVVHPAKGNVRLYEGVSGTHEASLRDDVRWPHCSQKLDTWHDVETIDAADLAPCDLLKVDTEGSEVEILNGYQHLGQVKVLLVEAHAVGGDLRGQIQEIARIAQAAGLEPVDIRGTVIRFVRKAAGLSVKVLPGLGLDTAWMVVESIGGARWLGKAVAAEDGVVVLSPAFEMAPTKLFFPQPQAGNDTLGLGELTLSGFWTSMGTPNRKVTVRWASCERLTDLPAEQQQQWVADIAHALGVKTPEPRLAVAP